MTEPTALNGDAPRYTTYMRLDEMHEADLNAKGHDGPRIRGSIGQFGFIDQAILDERTGKMVAGHGRLAQLRDMHADGQNAPDGIIVDADGMYRWPVTRGWSSRSDTEAHVVGVTLNRLTEAGGWDDLHTLTEILSSGYDLDPKLLEVSGYTLQELDTLRALTGDQGDDDDEDDESILNRTDRAAWPRITAQVPPDVYERWMEIPGNDDADRVMVVMRRWEETQAAATDTDDEAVGAR